MDTGRNDAPKIRGALQHMQQTAQALSGAAFGALAEEQQHAVQHILREVASMEQLLVDVMQTIGLLNIGQRYYLHERFQRHLLPILASVRDLQGNLHPPLTQTQLVCVQAIQEAGDDLQHNLDNLWTYSRIQNGKIQAVRGEFDVEDLLLPAAAQDHLPDGDAIQFEMQIPEVFPYIRGDLDRTREAFRQVLENAIHFTRQGQVRVTAVTGNNRAKIRVEDDGRGIPDEAQAAIFQPFYQVNPEERGMGLGLPIARALMEMQGGSLTMESEIGKGATFTLDLPTAQQA